MDDQMSPVLGAEGREGCAGGGGIDGYIERAAVGA